MCATGDQGSPGGKRAPEEGLGVSRPSFKDDLEIDLRVLPAARVVPMSGLRHVELWQTRSQTWLIKSIGLINSELFLCGLPTVCPRAPRESDGGDVTRASCWFSEKNHEGVT